METSKKVLELLDEKEKLFLEYEKETEKMMTNSIEDTDRIVDALEARQDLIEKIDYIDEDIHIACREDQNGAQILAAAYNRCGYAEVSGSCQEVFEKGQKIFQVIARIQSMEPQIALNIQEIKEQLQTKIRQNKKEIRFAGYFNHMGTGQSVTNGFLYDQKR